MEENNAKEINLLELIAIFLDWLKKIGIGILNFFGSIVRSIYRHKVIVVIVMLICFAIGQYMARTSNRKYYAEATAMLYGSDAQTAKEICKQLENTNKENKLISVGTKLSLPDSVAKNITEIKSFYAIDYTNDGVADKIDFDDDYSISGKTKLRMRDRIYLRFETHSISQVSKVQEAILNYFNNNELLRTNLESKRNELVQQIRICDLELLRIDSLAKVSYFKDNMKQLKFDKNELSLGNQNIQLFYTDLLQLQTVKSNSQSKLALITKPVIFPAGFVVDPIPVNSRLKYGVFSLLIGFGIALIIVGLIENLKKIFRYLNK